MSQHPSLLGSQKGKRHRSVFKRYEKLKHLMDKSKWDEKSSSIYALPKVKSVKFKIKKEKAAATVEAAPGAAAAGAPAQAAAGSQPQAQQSAGATKPGAEKQAPQKDKKTKA
jgi:small basic protein (TIGR04137 family)